MDPLALELVSAGGGELGESLFDCNGETDENPIIAYRSLDRLSRVRISLYARIVPEARKQAMQHMANRLLIE